MISIIENKNCFLRLNGDSFLKSSFTNCFENNCIVYKCRLLFIFKIIIFVIFLINLRYLYLSFFFNLKYILEKMVFINIDIYSSLLCRLANRATNALLKALSQLLSCSVHFTFYLLQSLAYHAAMLWAKLGTIVRG